MSLKGMHYNIFVWSMLLNICLFLKVSFLNFSHFAEKGYKSVHKTTFK
jgi:hypothetical protein